MQISILQGSPTGTAVYVETQTPTTNTNGLVSLEIGSGTVVSGDFTAIDWANDTYFIKTETNPTGITGPYTITGTSQLMSVPYALHAKTADSIVGGVNIPDLNSVLTEGNDGGGNDIINVGTLGIGTSTPNSGAALEVSSTTGALLLPRMTTLERNAIVTPESGMIIFNTVDKKFQGYVADSTQNYDIINPSGDPEQNTSNSCLGGPGQSFRADEDTDNWSILEVETCSNTEGIFTLTIYDGEGMGGIVLATQDVYLTSGVNQIPLLTPLTLVEDEQYTFSFGIGPGLRYSNDTDSYPDGTAYSVTSVFPGDLYFKILDGTVIYNDWVDLH
jgi:hypothetical protein